MNKFITLEVAYDGLLARAIHNGLITVQDGATFCANRFNVAMGLMELERINSPKTETRISCSDTDVFHRAVGMLDTLCGLGGVIRIDEATNEVVIDE